LFDGGRASGLTVCEAGFNGLSDKYLMDEVFPRGVLGETFYKLASFFFNARRSHHVPLLCVMMEKTIRQVSHGINGLVFLSHLYGELSFPVASSTDYPNYYSMLPLMP